MLHKKIFSVIAFFIFSSFVILPTNVLANIISCSAVGSPWTRTFLGDPVDMATFGNHFYFLDRSNGPNGAAVVITDQGNWYGRRYGVVDNQHLVTSYDNYYLTYPIQIPINGCFSSPTSLYIEDYKIYVADTGNHRVVQIDIVKGIGEASNFSGWIGKDSNSTASLHYWNAGDLNPISGIEGEDGSFIGPIAMAQKYDTLCVAENSGKDIRRLPKGYGKPWFTRWTSFSSVARMRLALDTAADVWFLYVLDGDQVKKIYLVDGSVKASTPPQSSTLVALTSDSSHLYVADKAGHILALHLNDLSPAGGSGTPVLSDPRALAMATSAMATGYLYALDGKYVKSFKIEPVVKSIQRPRTRTFPTTTMTTRIFYKPLNTRLIPLKH